MVALLCFFLTLLASPFKSKSRLEQIKDLRETVTKTAMESAKGLGQTAAVERVKDLGGLAS